MIQTKRIWNALLHSACGSIIKNGLGLLAIIGILALQMYINYMFLMQGWPNENNNIFLAFWMIWMEILAIVIICSVWIGCIEFGKTIQTEWKSQPQLHNCSFGKHLCKLFVKTNCFHNIRLICCLGTSVGGCFAFSYWVIQNWEPTGKWCLLGISCGFIIGCCFYTIWKTKKEIQAELAKPLIIQDGLV